MSGTERTLLYLGHAAVAMLALIGAMRVIRYVLTIATWLLHR